MLKDSALLHCTHFPARSASVLTLSLHVTFFAFLLTVSARSDTARRRLGNVLCCLEGIWRGTGGCLEGGQRFSVGFPEVSGPIQNFL